MTVTAINANYGGSPAVQRRRRTDAVVLERTGTERLSPPAAIFCIAVLAPDQRDVVAELLAVEVEEAVTVAVLLLPHSGEHPRRSGIALMHRIREVSIGTAVLLLESDGERQQLLLRQIREVLHRPASVPSLVRRKSGDVK